MKKHKKVQAYILTLLSLSQPVTFYAKPVQGLSLSPSTSKAAKEEWQQTVTRKLPPQIVTSSYNRTAFSNDGKITFLSASFGKSLYLLDTATGKVISSIKTGNRAAGIAVYDSNEKKYVAVVDLNNPSTGEFSTVSIIDFSDSRSPKLVSAFILEPDLTFSTFLTPVFDRDGSRLIVASGNKGVIFIIDTSTGRMLERVEVGGGIDSITITHPKIKASSGDLDTRPPRSILGAVSVADGRAYTFLLLSPNLGKTELLAQSFFKVPTRLIAQNNLSLNREGTVGYIASFNGDRIYSFDTITGQQIDSAEVGSGPAQIAISESSSRVRLAVVNAGRQKGLAADSVSILEAGTQKNQPGSFMSQPYLFFPQSQTDFVPDSPIFLTDKGKLGLVGSIKGQVFTFKAKTGEQLAETKVDAHDVKLSVTQNGEEASLVATSASNEIYLKLKKNEQASQERASLLETARVEVKSVESVVEKSQNSLVAEQIAARRVENVNQELEISKSSRIESVSFRRLRCGVRVYVKGNFQPGAILLVDGKPLKSVRSRSNSQMLVAKIPKRYIAPSTLIKRQRTFSFVVMNLDGSVSDGFQKRLQRVAKRS